MRVAVKISDPNNAPTLGEVERRDCFEQCSIVHKPKSDRAIAVLPDNIGVTISIEIGPTRRTRRSGQHNRRAQY